MPMPISIEIGVSAGIFKLKYIFISDRSKVQPKYHRNIQVQDKKFHVLKKMTNASALSDKKSNL